MRKFYQTEWFDIQFSSFAKLNSLVQADEFFYRMFYEEFFKKYNSYEDLPNNWKKEKKELAKFIFKDIKNKNKILSIGCGNGFIENEISKMRWGGNLMAIEPSLSTSSWLKNNTNIELLNGYFPNVLKGNNNFDFAYMSYIDYIFDDKMYIQMLKDIKSYPINEFLLIGASVYKPSIVKSTKYMIKNILAKFNLLNQQLWGYERTIEEHIYIFNSVGFKQIKYGQLENNTYWIKATNE